MWRYRATSQSPDRTNGASRVSIRNRRPIGLSIASTLILAAVVLALTAFTLIREGGAASAATAPACTPTPTPTKTPTATPTCTQAPAPTPTKSSPPPTSTSPSPAPTTGGSTGGSPGGSTGSSPGGTTSTTVRNSRTSTSTSRTHTSTTRKTARSATTSQNGQGAAPAAIGPLRAADSPARLGREVSSTSVPSLPFGALPQVPLGSLGRPAGNAASMFPTIGAEPNPAPQAAPGHGTEAAAADHGPLDKQLLGTQMLGLAALCAAVGILIARLTLRGHRPPRNPDGAQ